MCEWRQVADAGSILGLAVADRHPVVVHDLASDLSGARVEVVEATGVKHEAIGVPVYERV